MLLMYTVLTRLHLRANAVCMPSLLMLRYGTRQLDMGLITNGELTSLFPLALRKIGLLHE